MVGWTLMALCGAGFLWQLGLPQADTPQYLGLAFTPGVLFGGVGVPAGLYVLPPPMTLVSYMFLHGGWLHLCSNLLYLWVFAAAVESVLGHALFSALFIVCGLCAAVAHAVPDPSSATPLIGASGGVSGVLGAYLYLHPRADVRVLVPIGCVIDIVRVPAWVVLLAWFALQVLYALATPEQLGGVAFGAHVGGFVAGFALAPVLAWRTATSAGASTR